jgi:hypothetical protein
VREQLAHEDELEGLLQTLAEAADDVAEAGGARRRIAEAGRRLLRKGLDLTPEEAALLLDPALSDAMLAFVGGARRFDPTINGAAVYQAGRNAAPMCCLQLLLGRPVGLTPAMLGYSLLYPYSDNLLDDPRITPAEKAHFSARFGQRLQGQAASPASAAERQVFALVARIEGQWPRREYPQVYESLLLIHAAQTESVRLGLGQVSPYDVDVLGLSIAKGGASVLADGYLTAGALSEAAARAFYGFGAFLQWVDDLQDVERDRRAGQATVFSQTAGRWPLDGVTERLLRFGLGVAADMAASGEQAPAALGGLIRRSVGWLVADAAGRHPAYYSRRYLWRLQDHYPFRFGAIRRSGRASPGASLCSWR